MKLKVAIVLSFAWAVSASAITIDTVPVGNPGNAADTRYADSIHPVGVGSVSRAFNIGKTEITNAHYVAFLNAVAATDPYGLYSFKMGTPTFEGGILRSGASGNFSYAVKPPAANGYTFAQKPVLFVTWGDATRFANWLHNGQPTGPQVPGTTEDGAYTLNGAVTNAALNLVSRNPGARWWLPSEDEWYKGAYYDPAGFYYDYPTGTNTKPNNNAPVNDTGNSANFYDLGYTADDPNYPQTDVGAYTQSDSPYGTFDQGGNVNEWTDTFFSNHRFVRGDYWGDQLYDGLHAAQSFVGEPAVEYTGVGFRIATLAVPEPSTLLLALPGISRLAYPSPQIGPPQSPSNERVWTIKELIERAGET